ncbi:MAG: phospho-sugar mutase [Acidimicrobiia bacterium]|nr:phospho-sugar mutase [Acidimicrobiia bacterium]
MTAVMPPDLRASVDRWRRADPDPVTAAELDALVAARDVAELADRFSGRLRFGTAGLRGAVGAGPNRMNRLLVRYAAAGLMRWLGEGAKVVIGFDARPTSESFAAETATVVAALGGHAIVGAGPLPTPALAHAVLDRAADAGVMVTASHNPPGDNGYKVYLADGAQLIPPADSEIEAEIARAAAEGFVPPEVDASRTETGADFVGAYLDAMVATLPSAPPNAADLRLVYTPLHGVGWKPLVELFDRLGFPPLHVVPAQAEPDGTFPTTSFPNPEEPGALDLAFELATDLGADLIIANDPDADRLGVAIARRDGWQRLTGDELGLLLADRVLSSTSGVDRVVASSIVSSRSLAALAEARGVAYEPTLTGFKWIVRPGLAGDGRNFVFGYEEALGYAVSPLVRDKDGLSAAVQLVALAADLAARGRTLDDRLDELAAEIGLFVTAQRVERVEGAGASAALAAAMAALRADPPGDVGGVGVARVDDLAEGATLPPTDALILSLDDGSRIVLRPSGTEPKLKAYLEVQGDVAERDELDARIQRLADDTADLVRSRL